MGAMIVLTAYMAGTREELNALPELPVERRTSAGMRNYFHVRLTLLVAQTHAFKT